MIFFDLDNTLLDHDGAEQDAITAFADVHHAMIIDCPDGIGQAWRHITDQQRARWRAGELNFEQLRRARISALFKQPLTEAQADALSTEYYRIYQQHWRLFDDVLPALHVLRNIAPLAIITNGFAFQQEAKLTTTQIRPYFSHLVASEHVGAAKPAPAIFQHALRLSQKPASSCWYIGNHPVNDAQAAAKLGFKAVWLNREGHDGAGVTRVVRRLTGFADMVKMHY
ncbi:HAD family hydrolase [Photobacterium japonica]|uniref:HAD family hydrolase n=1 Tax=Photobacterium japonica TaxID=2910235 RepID=UPI003D0E609B